MLQFSFSYRAKRIEHAASRTNNSEKLSRGNLMCCGGSGGGVSGVCGFVLAMAMRYIFFFGNNLIMANYFENNCYHDDLYLLPLNAPSAARCEPIHS